MLRTDGLPGYWMAESTGALRPAIEAYLSGGPVSADQIAALRAYLRQWIFAPVWLGNDLIELRRRIDGLTSREAISAWLADALEIGIDPL